MTPTRIEYLARLRDRLQATDHGARQAVIAEAATILRCSVQTVYRQLAAIGHDSGRKRRSDAGETLLSMDELRLVAGVLLASANNKGQRMPVATALEMLYESGRLSTLVHESTVSRLLHQHRMHPDQLSNPAPTQQIASKHPNHVWQVDSTTGAYYYMPGGRLRFMDADEFYKNKVHNLVKASSDLLTRYAAADHTSGAFRIKHYLGGETTENLIDFLTWAMWKSPDCPMHGVPFMLVMDPGPANGSKVTRNFCKRLGIHLHLHEPGAAWVTGSVEKTHDIARMHFESRLRFVDRATMDLDLLNELVCRWSAAHCSSRKHSRHGATRFGKWLEIKADELRVAASLEALRDAAMHEPETRRVGNDKTVSFAGRTYDLSLVPGAVPGLKVTLAVNPFRAPAIDVLHTDIDTGAETWHVVEPVQVDAHGFRVGAPVWGESYSPASYTDVDHSRTALQREAYRTGDGLPTLQEAQRARKQHAQAYQGVVDAMADVNATQVPTYLPKRATRLDLPQRQVEARRISVVEAAKTLRNRLGAAYTPQVFADLSRDWPEGVPEDQLDAIAQRLAAPADQAEAPRLRAIGGGAA